MNFTYGNQGIFGVLACAYISKLGNISNNCIKALSASVFLSIFPLLHVGLASFYVCFAGAITTLGLLKSIRCLPCVDGLRELGPHTVPNLSSDT